MEFLHTMVRISNVEESLKFYCEGLGLKMSGALIMRRGASRLFSSLARKTWLALG